MIVLHGANSYFSSTIVDSLKKGTTVIVDRYAYSGVAYTAAKKVNMSFI